MRLHVSAQLSYFKSRSVILKATSSFSSPPVAPPASSLQILRLLVHRLTAHEPAAHSETGGVIAPPPRPLECGSNPNMVKMRAAPKTTWQLFH